MASLYLCVAREVGKTLWREEVTTLNNVFIDRNSCAFSSVKDSYLV